MEMSGWDFAVLGLTLIQLAGWAAIGIAVHRIIRGPIAAIRTPSAALVNKGVTFVGSGKRILTRGRTTVTALAGNVATLRRTLKFGTFREAFASEPVNPVRMVAALTTIRNARNGYKLLTSFRKRPGAAGTTATPAKVARPSIQERLGLVPPAARHLGSIVRVARIAVKVHRQLRDSGVL